MTDNWIYTVRSNTLQKRLFADLEKGVFTDVTIEVGSDGNQRTFKAHRLVLASENSELEKLLCGSFSGKIKVSDVHPKGFENLIRYCYGERIFVDVPYFCHTYFAAEKFKAKELQLIIENELIDRLKFENLVEILTLSTQLKMTRVKESCLAAISSRLESVLRTREFYSAPLEVIEPVLYLCRDRGLVFRKFVLKSIQKWTQLHKCSDIVTFRLLSMVQGEKCSPECVHMFKEKGLLLKESDFRATPKLLSPKEVCPLKNISLESANAVEKTLSPETTKVESSQVEHKPLLEDEKMVTDEMQESEAKDKKTIVVEKAATSELEGEKMNDAGYDSDEDGEVIKQDAIEDCMAEVSSLIKETFDFSSGKIVAKLIERADKLLKESAEEMQIAVDDLEDSFTHLNCNSNTAEKAEVKSE